MARVSSSYLDARARRRLLAAALTAISSMLASPAPALCDGTTIAGVEDIGAEGACAASGGRREPGHIAKYHCLTGTSPNGFLTGCDTIRSLADEYRCFNPRGLKYRYYFNNWELGHRQILNLRQHEVCARYYHSGTGGLDLSSPSARAAPLKVSSTISDAAKSGELIQEVPTLKCLGVRWLIGGDGNANARIAVDYRPVGVETWKQGLDLFRIETAGIRKPNRPAAGQTLFAGSIFDLQEDTEYEVRLSLHDPDGSDAERILRMRTWTEPRLALDAPKVDVHPGQLAEALARAQPGQVLRLHAGLYQGSFHPRSGTPGRPIGIVSAEDGAVILDGQGANNVISASGLHDVIFENLTFQNARWAIAVNGGANLVIRRCVIRDVDHGFVATRNAENQQHILIADNVLTGRSTWPRTAGIEDRRGVQIAGRGNVVCHNRISGFGDAIDTFSAYPCAAIDFYRNEISECTDDGIEMDYSEHNTRCFENRLTNVFQGISVQPVHGGPVYVFRNAIYNVGLETFKMHNHPSGAIFYHNTSVKAGMPLILATNDAVSNCVYRNNLFLGTTANYAYESNARMQSCDFDFDGFGGQWRLFLKWNGTRYATMETAAEGAPVYRHAINISADTVFQSGVRPPDAVKTQFDVKMNDLRLSANCDAVDSGVILKNINDGHQQGMPDLGAYELGCPLPHYGPR